MGIEALVTFTLASTLLTLAPGPDNIFVLTQSALYGRRSGILITLGLCTGLIVHTSAVALGVAAIFMVSLTAFTLLKLVGVAYLLFLAWSAFKTSARTMDGRKQELPVTRILYRRGIIMNLSNPKVAIFFLAFLPQFTNPNADNMTGQLFLLGLVFILITLVVFTAIACMAGIIAERLRRSERAQLLLNRLAGGVFIALALRLATTSR